MSFYKNITLFLEKGVFYPLFLYLCSAIADYAKKSTGIIPLCRGGNWLTYTLLEISLLHWSEAFCRMPEGGRIVSKRQVTPPLTLITSKNEHGTL